MAWLEKRGKKWDVAYRDEAGKVKRVPGYTDKLATKQLMAELERAWARGEQGLVDPYKEHKVRPLTDHVNDWVAELGQLGRDDAYVRPCKARLHRLIQECRWKRLGDINADSFCGWRETAMSDAGHNAKSAETKRPVRMGARTKNHYLEALRAFCHWCIQRNRLATNPMTHVEKVDQTVDVRRARRALSEEELLGLLKAVPERHALAYRVILATGLRRDELRQLRWGDLHLESVTPFLKLRARTTKSKRADSLPIRSDLAALLRGARGEADDADPVVPNVPTMEQHKGYLAAAEIPFLDGEGRRADFHALRHTFGTLLSKAGVSPRMAMELMRHTQIGLTMKHYTDPRIFDLVGAVEKLPKLSPDGAELAKATGTLDGRSAGGEGEQVAQRVARATSERHSVSSTGKSGGQPERSIKQVNASDWQSPASKFADRVKEPKMGVEPTTPALRKRCSAIELLRRPGSHLPPM